MNYITENEIDAISGVIGDKLRNEKKIDVIIQPNGMGDYWEGGIGGFFFRIKTETIVAIPESLAKMISQNRSVLRMSDDIRREYNGSGKKVN